MRWEGGGRMWEVLGLAGDVPHADVQSPLPRVLSQLLACATALVYDSSCSTCIPFPTFPVPKKTCGVPMHFLSPIHFWWSSHIWERTSLVFNWFESFLHLHKILLYGEQWTWPKIKPRVCVNCKPLQRWVKALLWGYWLCGFVFFSPLPIWPNFGLLSVLPHCLPLQACLEGLSNFGFKSESAFQQRKMVQNSEQWVSPDQINHPAPGIFSLSYWPQVSFPSHPPPECESPLSLPLPARWLIPSTLKWAPRQLSPYCPCHTGI